MIGPKHPEGRFPFEVLEDPSVERCSLYPCLYRPEVCLPERVWVSGVETVGGEGLYLCPSCLRALRATLKAAEKALRAAAQDAARPGGV